MDYVTAYDFANDSFRFGSTLIPIVFAVIGFGIAYYHSKKKYGHQFRVGVLVGSFGLLMSLFIIPSNIAKYFETNNIYETKQYRIVEGVVRGFDPMPYTGRKHESFTIKELKFDYSDYDHTYYGFNNTKSHGGPIDEGRQVRLAYFKSGKRNIILKIEIQKSDLAEIKKAAANIERPLPFGEPKLPKGPMGLIFKHFWVAMIIGICFQGRQWWREGEKLFPENPNLKSGYLRLITGYCFLSILPLLIMGAGCVFGDLTPFHYFNFFDNNPFIRAFTGIVIFEWVLASLWMFGMRGAEKLIKHPGIPGFNYKTAARIKLVWCLCLAGGIYALVASKTGMFLNY